MKRKGKLLLLLAVSLLVLAGWGQKKVELLSDKKLIDLSAAIGNCTLGAEDLIPDEGKETPNLSATPVPMTSVTPKPTVTPRPTAQPTRSPQPIIVPNAKTICALSFGPLDGFKLFGMTLFDLFDYVSSNIFLPVGGMFIALFVGWYLDKKIVRDEVTNNGTLRAPYLRLIVFILRYVAPIAIGFILINQLGLIKLF